MSKFALLKYLVRKTRYMALAERFKNAQSSMSNFLKSKSLQLCHIIKREDQERKKLAQIVDFFTLLQERILMIF